MQKVLFILLLIFFFTPEYSTAQNTKEDEFDSPYACPNFEFVKNMQKGDNDEGVYVLQQILNLDKRTLVAQTGPGSAGKETAVFGAGTREALKRFQALFIEYIEVADGKFNTKTRTVMNNVCKGPFFTGEGGNIYDTATKTDFIAPVIGISGPKTIDLNEDDKVRVYIGASEAIKTPTLTGLIIEGATAADLRKTSSTTFTFSVTPNEEVKDKITLQFEADSVEDLEGNKNENASNEWEIKVVKASTTVTTETPDTSILDDILNSVVSTIATSTNCSTVSSVDVRDYQNPCYGKVPMTGGQGNSPEEKKDDSLMQMLGGVLQGLLKALGGMKDAGGAVGGNAACACTGAPTIGFAAKKGVSGRQLDTITKGVGVGQFVGEQGPPPGICGEKKFSDQKTCSKACNGTCVGGCCNPQNDVTGMPVTGILKN